MKAAAARVDEGMTVSPEESRLVAEARYLLALHTLDVACQGYAKGMPRVLVRKWRDQVQRPNAEGGACGRARSLAACAPEWNRQKLSCSISAPEMFLRIAKWYSGYLPVRRASSGR